MKAFVGLLIVSVLFSFALFKNALNIGFLSDDYIWLANSSTDSLADVPRYLYDSEGFFFRPGTKTYFWIMWQLFGYAPFWYHLFNIVLHIVVSLFVYLLGIEMLKRAKAVSSNPNVWRLISGCASLLYLVHPVHLENIVWISAVTELIPAFCVVAILWLFVRDRASIWKYSLVFFLFVLGLSTHEYVVILPALLFLTDYFILHPSVRFRNYLDVQRRVISIFVSRVGFYTSLIAIDLLYLMLRSFSNAHWSGGDYSYNIVKLPFNFIGNLLGYLGLSFAGVDFIDNYLYLREQFRENIVVSVVAVLVVVLIVVFGFSKYKLWWHLIKNSTVRFVLYLCLFFVISLAPFLALGGIAERYLYLPSIVFCLALVVIVWNMCGWFYRSRLIFFSVFVFMYLVYFSFGIIRDLEEWYAADLVVKSRLEEFSKCETFGQSETLVRDRVQNRIGRAWVFQVGYEQAANILCPGKEITIITQ